MADVFNLGKLESIDPMHLYKQLENSVEFGDKEATAATKIDGKEGYLLGGLLSDDIVKVGLSEDTIGRLSNALSSENVRYAVFENDVRLGQLPLILTDNVRNYIENNLNELVSNEKLSWRIFFVPKDIDVDNNEMAGSDIITNQKNEPLAINYQDIKQYLMDNGHVEENNNEGMFGEEKPDDIDEQNSLINEDKNKAQNQDPDEDDLGQDDDDFDFSGDEDTVDQYVPEPEEETNNHVNDEKNNTENPLSELNDDEESTPFNDSNNHEEDHTSSVKQDDDSETNGETMENKKVTDENAKDFTENNVTTTSNQQNKEVIYDDKYVSKATTNYMMIPEPLQEILSNVYIGHFNEFPSDDVYKDTENLMKKEIRDANDVLKKYQEEIIRRGRQIYFNYMDQSFKKIKAVTDIETGNELVVKKTQEVRAAQYEIDKAYEQKIEEEKKRLEENFYGKKLDQYRQEVLANLERAFEETYYHSKVKQPLEEYERKKKQEFEDKKTALAEQYNTWLYNIEQTSIGKDQNNAINKVSEFVNKAIKDLEPNIENMENKLLTLNDKYLKLEAQHRADENLRQSVGSDLLTDEESKVYKERLENVRKEKEDLEEEKHNLNKEWKDKLNAVEEDKVNQRKQIEENHKKTIERIKNERNILNDELSSLKNTNQKLEDKNKKSKKKVLGTGIGGFVLAGLIFGGSALGIYSHNQDVQDKVEEQNKAVSQQKSKVKDTEAELDKIKKENKSNTEEKDKKIDQLEKDLDKAKKDKEKAEKKK